MEWAVELPSIGPCVRRSGSCCASRSDATITVNRNDNSTGRAKAIIFIPTNVSHRGTEAQRGQKKQQKETKLTKVAFAQGTFFVDIVSFCSFPFSPCLSASVCDFYSRRRLDCDTRSVASSASRSSE